MLAKLKDLYATSKPFRSLVYSGVAMLAAVAVQLSTHDFGGHYGAVLASVFSFAAAQLGSWLKSHSEAVA